MMFVVLESQVKHDEKDEIVRELKDIKKKRIVLCLEW